MDTTSYAAPARVKSLVLPASALSSTQFEDFYTRLSQACEVPLIDVHLPDDAPTRHFNPQANPTGRITFDFSTALIPEFQQPLLDLEFWRTQVLVVGVAHLSTLGSTDEASKTLQELRKRQPSALYHALFVFGIEDPTVHWPRSVYPVLESNVTSLDSLMSTLAGEFLARLSSFWTTRQLNSFQSPNMLVTPVSSAAHHHQNHHNHTHSTSGVGVSRHGSISMGSAERAKRRQDGRTRKFLGGFYLLSGLVPDALAELSAAAVVLRETGDSLWYGSALVEIALCLVLLRYENNPREVPSVAVSAAWNVALQRVKKHHQQGNQHSNQPSNQHTNQHTNQHVNQHANATNNATNNVATSGTTPTTHPSPPNTPPRRHSSTSHESPPRTSSSSIMRMPSLRKSKPFTEQTPIEELLEYILLAALEEYTRGTGSELVSHTVYYETVARYVNLLICVRHGWTKPALTAALRPRTANISLEDSLASTKISNPAPTPTTTQIEQWISKVYDMSLDQLGPDTHARILGIVAQLYARAGMKRKWAFACAQIVALLASTRATVDASLGHVEEVLLVYSKWPTLEASMLRNLVALGQRLKNPQLQIEAASRLLAMVCAGKRSMVDKEQMTMYHLIRSYGDVAQATFWDPHAVVGVTVKTHKLTTVRSSGKNTAGIIYNPFEGTELKEEGSIEDGVPTMAKIRLRNPLATDIAVFELVLVDSQGAHVSEVVKDVMIPALAQQHRVDAVVLPTTNSCADKSRLEVAGCYIQVSGSIGQVISLPTMVSVPVVPARPVLVLQQLSLFKGWTMLLEGERQRFSITLWNSSFKTPTRVLHFGFNDSTVDPLRQAVNRQDMSRTEFYEHEFFLHQRRAVNLIGEPCEEIPPRSSATFDLELYGKRGVTSAAVLVDYGLTEDCLRRLKIPLQATVAPSIVVDRVNIQRTSSAGTVLLVMDIRNAWCEQLRCCIWTTTEKTDKTEQEIPSGASSRFFITVPWSPLTLEELQQPVPSFAKRQFTVDTKTTAEQLELFWLREKLLEKLDGRWFAGHRSGDVDMRAIQLSRRMATVLKTSVVELVAAPMAKPVIDKPAVLSLTVNNKSKDEVTGMLRLICDKAAMRYMLVLGVSQQLVHVAPESTICATFRVLFLSHGPFELCTVLDSIDCNSPGIFQSQKTVVNI